MTSAIFTAVTASVTAFAGSLGTAFSDIVALFYDAQTGLTDLGNLLLISAGVALVYWVFYMIKSLVRIPVR